MSVTVTLDEAGLSSRLENGRLKAESMVAEQIIADCNQTYVPRQEGTLRDSARPEEHDGHMAAVWDTVYAAYQYYGCWPDGSHVIKNHTTAGTTTLWCEAARGAYGSDWERVAQNAFKEGAGG